MTTTEIAAIVVVLVIFAALVVWYILRRQRTQKLRSRFGPEYEHAVNQLGRTKAEEDLVRREKRVEKFPIRRISEPDRNRFAEQWHQTQTRFVDDPAGSIAEADRLVCQLMEARGYPVSDFERRAADLSVDHPMVVRHYRAAHAVAERLDQGQASTEDLRQALVNYRELFDELLEAHTTGARGVIR